MQLTLTIDGKKVFITVDSDKPLSLILRDDLDNMTIMSRCSNAMCGNCVVILGSTGFAYLSCLLPAFKLQNEHVITFEGFSKTLNCRDIEKAYAQTQCKPCPRCYASRTLLVESTLKAIEALEKDQQHKENEEIDKVILSEIKLNTCDCLEDNDVIRMVKEAYRIRKARAK